MVGQRLTHYRIVEQIGAGGMGVVYRARDERLDRDVALKVLPAGALSDEATRRRFRKEALALSKLNHPNIETIHEFDTQDGVDFLVMEYVAGTTLSEKLAATGSLPEKEVLSIGGQVAGALEEAHEQGVAHRDLKPGNIMLTSKGQVKVLDFGLAKLLRPEVDPEATRTVTETQGVVGTLPYMAPEQLRGEPADARTDIYALGAVLYELATGQRAFRESLVTRLTDAILHQPVVPPRAVHARITLELERIILKCLEKEAENRYQSAKELSVDLRRLAQPSGVSAVQAAGRRRWPVTALGLAAAVLVVLGALAGLNIGGWRDRLLGRTRVPRIDSLAVLPLANLSGDPQQDYFADGMTEALIADLAKIGALKVISRTSVMRYKGTQKSLPEIARELNVDAVIEGSVLRSGGRVRITVQLIQAATDEHVWVQNYERDLRDILALQGDVAQAIASEIQAKVMPQERARLRSSRPVNPEAHEAYLKGRYYLDKLTEEGFRKSLTYFHQALEKDPSYALAYAGLADAYYWASNNYLPPQEAMPKSREAAEKALERDETLADAHLWLASVKMAYDFDWVGAEREFQRAIELNPGHAQTRLSYGRFLALMGRFDDSISEIKHAQRLDPLSLLATNELSLPFMLSRRYDQAQEQQWKALEMDPNFYFAHYTLGDTYVQKREFVRAIAEFQKALKLEASPLMLTGLGRGYAAAGRRREAKKVLSELSKLYETSYAPPYDIALIYVAMGEKEQAFRWLEQAYNDRNEMMGWLKTDPRVDPLRSDPRFQDLLRRMNFPP